MSNLKFKAGFKWQRKESSKKIYGGQGALTLPIFYYYMIFLEVRVAADIPYRENSEHSSNIKKS